jgi:fructokinase
MSRIGIDLGGTKTEAVLIDSKGHIALRRRVSTPRKQGYEAIIASISRLVLDIEQESGLSCRVGIGTPGALSVHTGLIRNSNTRCLNGRPLLSDLEQALQRKLRLANDANCFVVSEAMDGAARDYDCVFGVILGTGVGGGIVMNGKLHTGHMNIAGEWGHNILLAGGPACYCGRHGCVETYLSGPGMSQDYHASGGRPDTAPQKIVDLAERGDPLASKTIERYLQHFGMAMAAVVNILDPDAIVLGGGMSNIELLYRRGADAVHRHVFNDYFDTPILRNAHGDSSGVLGAANLWAAGE